MRSTERQNWLDAGLLEKDSLLLDRPLPPSPLLVPQDIQLANSRLVWRDTPTSYGDEPYRRAKTPRDLLDRFVKLAGAADEEVLTFSRALGVLGICHHGLPLLHGQWQSWFGQAASCSFAEERGPRGSLFLSEPIAAWRRFAQKARRILSAAADLHRGRLAPPSEWKAILPPGTFRPHSPIYPGRLRARAAKTLLALVVNEWLTNGGARPWLVWGQVPKAGVQPGLRFFAPLLFGEIGIRLAMAVSRSDGPAVCTACGSPYVPKRTPSLTRRNFCPACGLKAAWRLASADYRHKQKGNGDAKEAQGKPRRDHHKKA